MGRHADDVAKRDRAPAPSKERSRAAVRVPRVGSLARSGDDRGTGAAGRIAGGLFLDALRPPAYSLACLKALFASAARGDASLPRTEHAAWAWGLAAPGAGARPPVGKKNKPVARSAHARRTDGW